MEVVSFGRREPCWVSQVEEVDSSLIREMQKKKTTFLSHLIDFVQILLYFDR